MNINLSNYLDKFKNQVLHNSTGNSPTTAQHDLSNNPISPINIVFNTEIDFS